MITTTGIFLRGWCIPDEGLWRILIDENLTAKLNINTQNRQIQKTTLQHTKNPTITTNPINQ